uniref:HEAT domain-containing protein n=1 Tax=Panagrellus redivivus TaxID=6233 RepID=A0A7E4VVF8_PANRE
MSDDESASETIIITRTRFNGATAVANAEAELDLDDDDDEPIKTKVYDPDRDQSPMPRGLDDDDDEDADFLSKVRIGLDVAALIAAAEEDFDLTETVVDAAVKTLMTGKEIQKLSIIKNLPQTIKDYPDETINKLLPLIQDIVSAEVSLDVHCDTSDLYKTLIKDRAYETRTPGLTDKLLNYILENIERVKDHVATAAWLETLLDIVTFITPKAVTELVIPVTVTQAGNRQRIQRRVIAARLIEKLCAIVPLDNIRKDLAPCAKMLCQDPNATVRTAIAQRLSVIAQSLNNSADCVSLLLPCLIELCKDDDPGVREAILNTIAVCLPYFTKESRKTVVIPLLRKCSEQALILRDSSLTVVAKQLGPWLFALKEILSPQEKRWFIDTYCRVIYMASDPGQKPLASLMLTCRRLSAFNFPCFALVYEGDVFTSKLLPVLEKFVADPDEEIRGTIAAGFHEVMNIRNEEPALLHIFVELVKSGAVEVIQHLVRNLHKAVPALYAAVAKEEQRRIPKVTKLQLDRLIVGCNRLTRNTGNWRSHESYLLNLPELREFVCPADMLATFVPILKEEVLTARALPCRIAAATSLLRIMRDMPAAKSRQVIIDFFTKTVAEHKSCHRRRLLLDIVPIVLDMFSRRFFKEHILAPVLKLADDPVSNIRLQQCRLMPLIKKSLYIPEDEQVLISLEKSVGTLLRTEGGSAHDRQLFRQYACELSRVEPLENAKSDAVKVAEEDRIWTEEEDKVSPTSINGITSPPPAPGVRKASLRKGIVHVRKAGNLVVAGSNGSASPPKDSGSRSYGSSLPVPSSDSKPPSWKTNRLVDKSKIAVVRPQPQITITQRSPSPMPPKNEEKGGSKLPLATRYRSLTSSSSGSSSPTTSSASTSSPPSTSRYYSSSSLTRPTASSTSRLYSSPSASSIMSKSYTSSYSSPTSTTGPYSSGLMSSRSMSTLRRPYGLMKVQSSSAIERKPANLSIRVTGMS